MITSIHTTYNNYDHLDTNSFTQKVQLKALLSNEVLGWLLNIFLGLKTQYCKERKAKKSVSTHFTKLDINSLI